MEGVSMLRFLGKTILSLALLAFVAAVSLFVVGSYIVTWPVLRLPPKSRKRAAMLQAGVSLFALSQAFAPEDNPEDPSEVVSKS